MVSWQHLIPPAVGLVVCALGGLLYAVWGDYRARRSLPSVRGGRGVTVPVMVSVGGDQRTGRAVLDDQAVRVVGKGLHLVVGRDEYAKAGLRRGRFDDERFEFAEQRGFTDASGTRYLVGPLEEWEPAFTAALEQPPRPVSSARLVRAAIPLNLLAATVLAVLAMTGFQALWSAGHDVDAAMVRVVGDEGMEACGVRWSDHGRAQYAEVDCYAPFPKSGDPVRIRALAWPFRGEAMDYEGSYEIVTAFLGGAALVLGVWVAASTRHRVRRPAVRLVAVEAPAVELRSSNSVSVDADAPLVDLIDAVALREDWDHEVVDEPPVQPSYARYLMAVSAGRWWPGLVLAGVALLVDGLPDPVRGALAAGAVAAVGWAAFRALTAWLAIRKAYAGPVTSEWDYRLVRSVEDEWFAMLLLGQSPHWMVLLDGPGHPAPRGRCGVRGDLTDGGAIHLRIGGHFWPTRSPVSRVDDELLRDVRDDLVARLAGSAGHDDGRGGAHTVTS